MWSLEAGRNKRRRKWFGPSALTRSAPSVEHSPWSPVFFENKKQTQCVYFLWIYSKILGEKRSKKQWLFTAGYVSCVIPIKAIDRSMDWLIDCLVGFHHTSVDFSAAIWLLNQSLAIILIGKMSLFELDYFYFWLESFFYDQIDYLIRSLNSWVID